MKRTFIYILLSLVALPFMAQQNTYKLLIGTYTNTGKSQGIYSYSLDLKNYIFTPKSVATEMENPSYLALSSDKKYMYVVSESGSNSKVGAFKFDKLNGTFSFINNSNTRGFDPCFVSVTKQHVITANYTGGSVSVFGRNANGSLTDALQVVHHTGHGLDTVRQATPHVHQALFTPDKKHLLVNDLGTDNVMVYKYDSASKADALKFSDCMKLKPGSGPRHLTITKSGRTVYVLQELDGTLSVLRLTDGRLSVLQETSVVRKVGLQASAADIHLSPDGQFLYATNRGMANDISCFSLDKNGLLTFVQQCSTGGVSPRNFAITPDGKFLLVANQKSDNIAIFERNITTGLLTNTGKRIAVGAPVCLVFY